MWEYTGTKTGAPRCTLSPHAGQRVKNWWFDAVTIGVATGELDKARGLCEIWPEPLGTVTE